MFSDSSIRYLSSITEGDQRVCVYVCVCEGGGG